MITLYEIPVSPYAQKVKLALLEKQLEFEAKIPNLDAPEPAFLAASPRLEVPALVDDAVALFDSTITSSTWKNAGPNARCSRRAPPNARACA